jgi:hypothetical protein
MGPGAPVASAGARRIGRLASHSWTERSVSRQELRGRLHFCMERVWLGNGIARCRTSSEPASISPEMGATDYSGASVGLFIDSRAAASFPQSLPATVRHSRLILVSLLLAVANGLGFADDAQNLPHFPVILLAPS